MGQKINHCPTVGNLGPQWIRCFVGLWDMWDSKYTLYKRVCMQRVLIDSKQEFNTHASRV